MTANKHIKIITLLSLILLNYSNTYSQVQSSYILHHKNGSKVKGIIERQTNDTIVLKTKNQDIFVFARKDVLSIETYRLRAKNFDYKYGAEYKEGFYNYSTIGLLSGNSVNNEKASFTFSTNFGYEFRPWFGIGLGVGLDELHTQLLPIHIGIRSNILNFRNSPTMNLKIGYAVPLSRTGENNKTQNIEYKGGFHLGFDVGVASFRSNNYAFTITAGYEYQQMSETITPNNYVPHIPWNVKEESNFYYHKIAVKLGFLFKINKPEEYLGR